jgi:EAL domain-containing protein (putative c-di-GMP-specific phosphodiesterase class I)
MAEGETELLFSAVSYAESLVKPAEDETTLRAATDAIASLGMRILAPDAATARDAARLRGLGVSLADGFALAAALLHDASVASFDERVRRALRPAGLGLCEPLA